MSIIDLILLSIGPLPSFKEVSDNTDSEALHRDLDRWQIEFNVKKCKVMPIGRQFDCCEYYMGANNLVEESLEKDFGV